jgi:hypothetical protein
MSNATSERSIAASRILTPPGALALLFGFAFGVIVSELVFDRIDEMFYKGIAEELRKYFNESKASLEHCETTLADINAKYKLLEDERNRLQSSYDSRDQFINVLRSFPVRSCDREFLLQAVKVRRHERAALSLRRSLSLRNLPERQSSFLEATRPPEIKQEEGIGNIQDLFLLVPVDSSFVWEFFES